MEVRNPRSGELGLLVLLLKDLLSGDVAVGGTSSIGRGRFGGTATVLMEDGTRVTLDPACPVGQGVDDAIREFREAERLGGDS